MKLILPKMFGALAAAAATLAALQYDQLVARVGADAAPYVFVGAVLVGALSHSLFGDGGKPGAA